MHSPQAQPIACLPGEDCLIGPIQIHPCWSCLVTASLMSQLPLNTVTPNPWHYRAAGHGQSLQSAPGLWDPIVKLWGADSLQHKQCTIDYSEWWGGHVGAPGSGARSQVQPLQSLCIVVRDLSPDILYLFSMRHLSFGVLQVHFIFLVVLYTCTFHTIVL